jgi:putative endonuclease
VNLVVVTDASAWVYLLACADGSLYCGWTTDLERRVAMHARGRGARYTRSRLPVRLALALAMPDSRSARREEARIKRLPRAAKLALIATQPEPTTRAGGTRSVARRVGREPVPAERAV